MPTTFRKHLVRHGSLVAGAGIALALAGQQIGCSSTPGGTPGQASGTTPGSSDVGTAVLALTLPGGEMLGSVSWVVTGPNGGSTVVQQGTVNVQSSNSISFQVGGLPQGTGYTITLTGTSTDGSVSCLGSAVFSIVSRMTTNVTAVLQCSAAASEAGSAFIGVQTANCATAGSLSASPAETTVGSSMALTATSTSPNPAAATYAWSAPSGTFSAPGSASTNFTCTAPGPVILTVTVSDGAVPDGGACNPALATTSVQVQCDAPVDAGADATVDSGGGNACNLGPSGTIKHVIYVQFDNTHLSRDPSNDLGSVPSDLEQMPHLLNFIRGNGTMMANDHTILISHTGGGFLSTYTGVYPDRHGQTVSNSYVRTSATGGFEFPSSFGYWTDPASSSTSLPNMIGPNGTNIPAPFVNYTRAGCNFGAVAGANVVLENTGTGASGDVTTIFGSGSPQFAEAQAANAASGAAKQLAQTDLEGLAIHCAQGSPLCASGEADRLPAEPGGYTGFSGLFGAKQIDPILTNTGDASVAVNDINGTPIVDPFGQPGFPGFDGMSAAVSLGYVAAMQEHGVPVTYAYISDAHDNHGVAGNTHNAYGPGAAGYVQQLAAYDAAFAAFFTRLAADGIDKTNTLFVFTVDEGDHFVGGTPTPANCDGVNTPCDWTNQIGEINANIDTLMSNQFPTIASKFLPVSTAVNNFTVHGDDAPTFYLSRVRGDAGAAGALGQTDPDTRTFERSVAQLTATNPYNGHLDSLLFKMADQTTMSALHMMTAGDPARNPTFVLFGNDDYFITDFPSSTCLTCIGASFAWNHGDDQSVIGQTWVGFVGPGVKNQADLTTFTDHTDVRPTINSVLGLHDDYVSDGRVITQALTSSGYASTLAGNLSTVEALGDSYKSATAPFGAFASCLLTASTAALQADDTTYASIESSIATLASQRDALTTPIRTALDGAEFGGTAIDTTQANSWISQVSTLLSSCQALDDSIAASDAGSDAASSNDAGSSTDGGSTDSGGATDTGPSDAQGDASPAVYVYRVGTGGDSGALSGTATAVFLDEFSAAGSLVGTIAMPTAASGGNNPLVSSGSATSEGLMTRSVDGHFIVLTGYDAAPGTASIASTVSTSVPRVVGRVDAEGNVNTTTLLNTFSGNNPRSVASDNGTNLWLGGANTGVVFATVGSSAFTALNTATTNLRQVAISGGQLYASSSSGALRLGTVGTGLPTTATQTITNLPGFSTSTGSPYGYFFADLDGVAGVDTVYVADDSAGITKYSLVSGNWTASGTVGSGSDSYRGITGSVSGTTVTLFATGAPSGSAKLVTLVDATGYNATLTATPTTIATAAANTAFRGVALAPIP